ncbi:hypothetical protein GCM10010402_76280 [Actinomadura luteofluorescens]
MHGEAQHVAVEALGARRIAGAKQDAAAQYVHATILTRCPSAARTAAPGAGLVGRGQSAKLAR